jgi:hypothetical protein
MKFFNQNTIQNYWIKFKYNKTKIYQCYQDMNKNIKFNESLIKILKKDFLFNEYVKY